MLYFGRTCSKIYLRKGFVLKTIKKLTRVVKDFQWAIKFARFTVFLLPDRGKNIFRESKKNWKCRLLLYLLLWWPNEIVVNDNFFLTRRFWFLVISWKIGILSKFNSMLQPNNPTYTQIAQRTESEGSS